MLEKSFDIIAFDLDSTLVTIEGLDWLASKNGHAQAIQRITAAGMNGQLTFAASLRQRLAILKPNLSDLKTLARAYLQSFVPGAITLVKLLHVLNKQVWIVTGALEIPALAVARHLHIPKNRVVARTISKRQALRHLKGLHRLAFVGDGANDLEAKDAVDLFIGYGGVVKRDIVAHNAPVFVDSPSLLSLLPHLLTQSELASIKTHAILTSPL